MAGLVQLTFLALEENQISGPVPAWLSGYRQLSYLALGSNALTGSLPSFLGMDMLEEIALDSNRLSGPIDALNDAFNLRVIFLSNNKFDGHIDDDSLGELGSLGTLDAGSNLLTGAFPASFYLMDEVDLSNNQLTGMMDLPDTDLSMTFLSLYGNNMKGGIPAALNFLTELTYLDLSNNLLDGDAYDVFNQMGTLESLNLSNNSFSGNIPDLQDCAGLLELTLADNKFDGSIPDWIGSTLSMLTLLDLHGNALTGAIPSSIGNLHNATMLFLNRNKLNSTVPTELASLSKLSTSLTDSQPSAPSSFHGSDLCACLLQQHCSLTTTD